MDWLERSMIDIPLKSVRSEIRSGAIVIPDDCEMTDKFSWWEVRGVVYWWCEKNNISPKRRGELCNLISVAVRTALNLKAVWNLQDKDLEVAKIIALTILTTIEYFKPDSSETNKQKFNPDDFNFKTI